ncbi:MAG: PEGA domain-containing protein [Polyangiales bacterium]
MRLLSAALLLSFASFSAAHAQDVPETEPERDTPANAEASAQPPPPPDAFLLVTVNVPGANIVVDENQTIAAPASALRIPAGTHTIAVSAEGYEAFQQSIQVPSEGARVDVYLDRSASLTARMERDDTYESSEDSVHQKWWFWAAIGGGVVVVAGVIAAIALASGGDDGQEVIPVPPIPGGP